MIVGAQSTAVLRNKLQSLAPVDSAKRQKELTLDIALPKPEVQKESLIEPSKAADPLPAPAPAATGKKAEVSFQVQSESCRKTRCNIRLLNTARTSA